MRNKTVFLTVIAIFTFSAFRVWQGILAEGFSLLRALSLVLLLVGISLLLISRMKAFMREVRKSWKK